MGNSATSPLNDEEILVPPWGEYGRASVVGVVTLLSKIVLGMCNRTVVKHQDIMEHCVMHRKGGQGLLTVSNHVSTLDDPMVLSALLPWSFFLGERQHHGTRWALCAREICHTNFFFTQFFLSGKTLPIDRGKGLFQPIMRTAAHRLAAGDWVHVFPEGKVTYSGNMGPFKWGVGKVVCDCVMETGRPPVILPLYHSGMGHVLPKGKMVPRIGKTVHISVGEPIDISDIVPRCHENGEDLQQVWRDITLRISQKLRELEATCPPNVDQFQHEMDSRGELKDTNPVLPEVNGVNGLNGINGKDKSL